MNAASELEGVRMAIHSLTNIASRRAHELSLARATVNGIRPKPIDYQFELTRARIANDAYTAALELYRSLVIEYDALV